MAKADERRTVAAMGGDACGSGMDSAGGADGALPSIRNVSHPTGRAGRGTAGAGEARKAAEKPSPGASNGLEAPKPRPGDSAGHAGEGGTGEVATALATPAAPESWSASAKRLAESMRSSSSEGSSVCLDTTSRQENTSSSELETDCEIKTV